MCYWCKFTEEFFFPEATKVYLTEVVLEQKIIPLCKSVCEDPSLLPMDLSALVVRISFTCVPFLPVDNTDERMEETARVIGDQCRILTTWVRNVDRLDRFRDDKAQLGIRFLAACSKCNIFFDCSLVLFPETCLCVPCLSISEQVICYNPSVRDGLFFFHHWVTLLQLLAFIIKSSKIWSCLGAQSIFVVCGDVFLMEAALRGMGYWP